MTDGKRHLPDDMPLPLLDDRNRQFFTSGTLALQTCRSCRVVQHPAGEFCFTCGSFEFDYPEVPPTGVISSYTTVHHVTHRALTDSVPYDVVIVEIDAHPEVRLVGNLIGEVAAPRIGARVRGEWTEPLVSAEQEPVRLLQWRLEE
ncbi:Zn-ribbon domain-containing OB-fold protein [Gordonia sp. NPDC127522]|uniref:Zn-ribbon domain-containing OB-fold protein n=1 Tax=Gordonia sp. NPDC127522 TaxID=3345390 RepID=UPI003635032C